MAQDSYGGAQNVNPYVAAQLANHGMTFNQWQSSAPDFYTNPANKGPGDATANANPLFGLNGTQSAPTINQSQPTSTMGRQTMPGATAAPPTNPYSAPQSTGQTMGRRAPVMADAQGFGSGSGSVSSPTDGSPLQTWQTGGADPRGGYTPRGTQTFGTGSGSTPSPTDGNQGQTWQTGGTDRRPPVGPGSSTGGGTNPGQNGTPGQSGGLFGLGITPPPNLANGAPDFMGLANLQSQYNHNNAQQQSQLNNPNFYGPGGSQTRTQNADGSWSVNQTLNPDLQNAYSQQNQLKSQLLGNASQLAGQGALNYNGVAPSAQYNTSDVSGIPNANADDLAQTRDSVYRQKTQYLDPQFQQAQSDMESKLANQGIMPGSEAYQREMDNFARTKQKAYGDASDSAIQAGGAEQSRLFGLGLQSHTTGMNDALQGFQTGMAGRQQGVSEANALHNAPINDINALNGVSNTTQLPTYPGQTGTSIPGVDFMNAGSLQNNANLGISNANAASSQNNANALYGLGGAFLQSPQGQNLLNNFFGGNTQNYNTWLSNNQETLNSTGMTPAELLGSF